jgi:hypothetical protein
MKRRLLLREIGILVLALGLLAVGFVLGRQTGPNPAASRSAGHDDGYVQGLAVGRAGGLAQGRALQFGATLPAGDQGTAQAQFQAGYRAGAEDVFSGYDGGWALGRPYLIVLSPGLDGITYRISHREEYVRASSKGVG